MKFAILLIARVVGDSEYVITRGDVTGYDIASMGETPNERRGVEGCNGWEHGIREHDQIANRMVSKLDHKV